MNAFTTGKRVQLLIPSELSPKRGCRPKRVKTGLGVDFGIDEAINSFGLG